MPRISRIEMMVQREQPTLTIRALVPVEKFPKIIGETCEKVRTYLEEIGELKSGVSFGAYHNFDRKNLDIEIGFPVARPLVGKGDIMAGFIPEEKVLFCLYKGPYKAVGPVYKEMDQWIADNGFTASSTVYEHYYNGLEFPENELITKILIPIRK